MAPFAIYSALQTWRLSHFGTAENTGAAANNADPDNDGLENLIEFAFALDPKVSSAGAWPAWQLKDDDYVLSFTPPASATGITYIAEFSTSLAPENWTAIPNSLAPPPHLYYTPAGLRRYFLRLRVTAP